MTTLAIEPRWEDKTAKARGTVAAGEHVAVSIANDNGSGAAFITDTQHLRLRVLGDCGETLAVFPMPDTPPPDDAGDWIMPSDAEEGDAEEPAEEPSNEWSSSGTTLSCVLNLNTMQMFRAVPPTEDARQFQFVIDDAEDKTLYCKGRLEVVYWPRYRNLCHCREAQP